MKQEIAHGILSSIIGCFAFLLGGFDSLLISLFVVMGCDWVTGVLKALKKKKFSPDVSLWGLANKVVSLIVVVSINFIQKGANINLPLRETVIVMLLINEGMSVLRNSSSFVKGLQPLEKYFQNVKLNILKIFTIEGEES